MAATCDTPFPAWEFIRAMIALAVSGEKGKAILDTHAEALAQQAAKSPEEIRKAIQELAATKDAWKGVLAAITDDRVKHAIMHEIYTQAYLDGILTPEEMRHAEEIRQVLHISPAVIQEVKNVVLKEKIL